jgi:hypothetical protein
MEVNKNQNIFRLNTDEYILLLLRDLCIKKIKQADSLSELSKKVNLESTNPLFNKAINLMLDHNIAKKEHGIYNQKKIRINQRKLELYIREHSNDFKKWDDFIHSTTLGANTG